MLDVKAWLEQAGEPVADTSFLPDDLVTLPYICFLDKQQCEGADLKKDLINHSLTVERYSETSNDNEALEKLFDDKNIKYMKERLWLPDQFEFETIYNFDLLERT